MTVSAEDGSLRLGLALNETWVREPAMDKRIARMRPFTNIKQLEREVVQSVSSPIGRNNRCPCGSGLKYKNCHGR